MYLELTSDDKETDYMFAYIVFDCCNGSLLHLALNWNADLKIKYCCCVVSSSTCSLLCNKKMTNATSVENHCIHTTLVYIYAHYPIQLLLMVESCRILIKVST